ncbi:hypothetical protein AB4305_12825 [Nocardia sp. 2YAB30]|uniref:hypothetical protein n=1 Tax=unclassified Nocardia TaxID=2637762 RepID=UPI003F9E872D
MIGWYGGTQMLYGNLNQSFVTDISWRTAIGHDAGAAFSLSRGHRNTVVVNGVMRRLGVMRWTL